MKNVILCMFIDKQGNIRKSPKFFKPQTADICVSDYELGNITDNTLYLSLLDIKPEVEESTCWTAKEVIRRGAEDCEIKVFAMFEHFYEEMTEVNFAFFNGVFDEFDTSIDINVFKECVKDFEKKSIGENNNIKFFKYT
ncbi:MAG: hypothetical protein ACRCRT_00895, partial [Cetobacterium somerae]